jgi:hypothetical protein
MLLILTMRHFRFLPQTDLYGDVVLMQLARPTSLAPIGLNRDAGLDDAGSRATVLGWGVNAQGILPDTLQACVGGPGLQALRAYGLI